MLDYAPWSMQVARTRNQSESASFGLLETVIGKFAGGPVGLDTIAAATNEEADTIEDVYEPYLLQLGFLQRTPRGRVATPLAYAHLGKVMPRTAGDTSAVQPTLFGS